MSLLAGSTSRLGDLSTPFRDSGASAEISSTTSAVPNVRSNAINCAEVGYKFWSRACLALVPFCRSADTHVKQIRASGRTKCLAKCVVCSPVITPTDERVRTQKRSNPANSRYARSEYPHEWFMTVTTVLAGCIPGGTGSIPDEFVPFE